MLQQFIDALTKPGVDEYTGVVGLVVAILAVSVIAFFARRVPTNDWVA
ncbi:MAG: hypothetical protein G01um101466_272 [Parcubacteria group bacterium Gr01-1014_66]|nr:MAG: hypothetical protein G01um101466_272 [Parcubacteria group bacterium Gr01-1014_66]